MKKNSIPKNHIILVSKFAHSDASKNGLSYVNDGLFSCLNKDQIFC